MNITKYWPQISLLVCIFFVTEALSLNHNPWLIALDSVLSIYWANEFVQSIKKSTSPNE